MKPIFEGFLALALFAALTFSDAQAQNSVRIVVFGDSLMSGYQLQPEQAFPARLDRKLKASGYANTEVLTMSVADATTASGLARMDELLAKRPDIVILELGLNDALRGIKMNFIYGNLAAMIGRIGQIGGQTVVIGVKPPNLPYAYAGQLTATYRQLAGIRGNIGFYPDALNGIIGNHDLTLADKMHPNAKGVETMLERMYPTLDAAVRWKWETLRYQQQFGQTPEPEVKPPPAIAR